MGASHSAVRLATATAGLEQVAHDLHRVHVENVEQLSHVRSWLPGDLDALYATLQEMHRQLLNTERESSTRLSHMLVTHASAIEAKDEAYKHMQVHGLLPTKVETIVYTSLVTCLDLACPGLAWLVFACRDSTRSTRLDSTRLDSTRSSTRLVSSRPPPRSLVSISSFVNSRMTAHRRNTNGQPGIVRRSIRRRHGK